MANNDIVSKIIKTTLIEWKKLSFIQGDSFKEWVEGGEEELGQSLSNYGFIDPFKVWEDKDGTIYCLDGRHRYLKLLAYEDAGVPIPELVEAIFIDCVDIYQAAEMVLVYSSYYAKIRQEGLHTFLNTYNLDFNKITPSLHLPEFSFSRYEQKFDAKNITDIGNDDNFQNSNLPVIVNNGDIFQLNNHIVACTTFQDEALVDEMMQGSKARIVITDPPYNLPTKFFSTKHKKDFAMGAGEMSDAAFSEFLSSIMGVSRKHTVHGGIHYIFMDFRHCWHMMDAAKNIYGTYQPKQICVWVKDIMANGSFYRAQQELCFLFNNGEARHLWNKDLIDEGGFYKNNNELCYVFKNGNGAKHLSHLALQDRIRTNVWRYPSAVSVANPDRDQIKHHATPKPVAMIADAILDTTNVGDIVIDWFLGSGTALIACEKTGRTGRFTEIEPDNVQNAIIRYITYCDKKGVPIEFKHLNGNLQLSAFINKD